MTACSAASEPRAVILSAQREGSQSKTCSARMGMMRERKEDAS
jgi:hypothetical protein